MGAGALWLGEACRMSLATRHGSHPGSRSRGDRAIGIALRVREHAANQQRYKNRETVLHL